MSASASATMELVQLPDPTDRQLAAAFRRAGVSLSLSDPHGRIIEANDEFYELFGHSRDAALDVGMLARADDQEWTLSYLTRLISGDLDEFKSVKRFVRADDSEFDGSVTIRAIREDGLCSGLIARVEPVEVRPTVDNLRVRKLLEHAAGALTLIDANGTVIETSGRYRIALGYPAEFWEERTIADLVVPDDLELVTAMRERVLARPAAVVTEDIRVQNADRSIDIVEVTALNMLHDPDLRGIVLSTHNVTAERSNVRAIAKLRDEAVAEAEHRSNLLATVSHELRNPLHAMSGLAELLASDDTLDVGPRDLAASLRRQLDRLASVTDDLLDTARLEVGRFELRPTSVIVRDLVDDVVRVARSSADGRIRVDSTVASDVPQLILADAARLQQVLGNLLGNAVKFTEAGGVDVDVSMTSDGEQLCFEVTDTGVGIPRDQLDSVFVAFSTATTSGDRRGAGLGLAIVQRLVAAFGGTVSVTSEVGVGSVFTVTVPVVEHLATPVEPDAGPIIGATRRHVLVVEDTPVNQQLAGAQLERLGLDSTVASSAEEGLDLLAERSFDVILMDHQLPGMNGRDATREIRRRGLTTPIVGITASATAADERACFEAGMTAFLPKPVGLERLRAVLDETLSGLAAAAQAAQPRQSDLHRTTVDVAVLDRLVGELGDRTLVEGLVRTFLVELETRGTDVAGADDALAARQAHTLKSSAKLLGAIELAELCAIAEEDASRRGEVAAAAAGAESGLRAWLDAGITLPADGDDDTGGADRATNAEGVTR